MGPLRKFVDWIKLKGVTEGLSEPEARAVRTTGSIQVIMFALPSLLAAPVYFTEAPETHLFTYSHYFLLVIPLGIARALLFKRRFAIAAGLTLVAVNYHMAALSMAQADDPASLGFLITLIAPFLMFERNRVKTRWAFVILPALLFLFFQFYYRVLGGSAIFGPPKWIVPADYVMPPLVLLTFFLVLIIYQFVKAVNVAEDKLAAEHAQSERLLLNILPAEVASELKEHGASKPRHYPSATVCFTDFEGFTKIAESLAPSELVAELDRCFSYFDSLMDRYNLEKLWQLRLGIHSGDLVAGVIGEKKFAYDVWSDTVNTASRCESSGLTGRINISGATYALVKDFFDCEYRGAVDAKHKGLIDMYLVNGLLPELQRADHSRAPNSEFEARYAALRG